MCWLQCCERKTDQAAPPSITIEEDSVLSSRQLLIREKLNTIIVPQIKFENTPLDEAIEYLAQKSIELDPDSEPTRRGISFVIETESVTTTSGVDEDLGSNGLLLGTDPNAKIIENYHVTNTPLGKALSEVCELVDLKVYIDKIIVIMPKDNAPPSKEAVLLWPEQ